MKKLLLLLLTLIAFAPPLLRAEKVGVEATTTLFSTINKGNVAKPASKFIGYNLWYNTIENEELIEFDQENPPFIMKNLLKTMVFNVVDDDFTPAEGSDETRYLKDGLIIDFDMSGCSEESKLSWFANWVYINKGTTFTIRTKYPNGKILSVELASKPQVENPTARFDLSIIGDYEGQSAAGFWEVKPVANNTKEKRMIYTFTQQHWKPNNISFKCGTTEVTGLTVAKVTWIPGYPEPPKLPVIEETNAYETEDGYTFFSSATAKVSSTEGSKIYWEITEDPNKVEPTIGTDNVVESGGVITINKTGRLLLMAVDANDPDLKSTPNEYLFTKSNAVPFTSLDDLIDSNGQNTGVEAMLNMSLNIVGAYETNAENPTNLPTYYAYVRDENDRYIKLVSQGKPFPSSWFSIGDHESFSVHEGVFLESGSVVGEYRYNYGLPEIYVKTPINDYTAFLKEATKNRPGPIQYKFPLIKRDVSTTITEDMFNRYVILEVTAVGSNTEVVDASGARLQLMNRLVVPKYIQSGEPTEGTQVPFDELVGTLKAGHKYRIHGYIGQLRGTLKIFPVETLWELPGEASVMAPNALSGIVNIISDEIKIWLNPEYSVANEKYEYQLYDSKTSFSGWTAILPGEENGATLDIATLFGENTEMKMAVRSQINPPVCHGHSGDFRTFYGPETVLTLRRHQSTPVQSIAEYKEKYLGKEEDLPEMITGDAADFTATAYHKFADDSRAVIIETTPEWLYVRDLEPTAADGKFHSDNYILIHNENGWSNPTVTAEGRELRQGDIISGFALIPAKTGRGNLVSESTGFARTVKFVGVHSPAEGEQFPIYDPIDVGYVDPGNPGYYTNVNPGEEDRMRLIELRNVQVTRTGTSTADYVYTMKLGDGTHTYTVATDIFEHRLQGWHTAYDDETRAEDANTFNLYGIMIKNGTGYALAMIDYDTKLGSVAAPAVFAEGGENPGDEVQPFVNKLTVGITTEPGTFVYYSLNGKNPLVNTDSETRKLYDGNPFEVALAEGSDRVVVQAFAFKPGMKPSELVTRTFVKQSRELSLLLNFIGRAEKDAVYHFNGTVKVADVVGDYLMVRGVAGHYMPIYSAAGWENLKRGDYLTDFLMLPQFAGEDDAAVLRGATVAEGAEDMFEPVSGGSLPEIDVTTAAEVSNLTGNLRRKVMLTNALFVAATGERSGAWMIKGSGEGATALAVNTEHTGLDLSDVRDNVNYNVTGYIMATTDGSEVEFWPIEKVMLATPAPVKADVKATATAASGNEYTATFYPMAEVTLTHEDPRATIYYMIGDDDTDGSTRWYEYYPGRPIVISESSRIHARAVNAQGRSSVETHVTLTRLEPAGAVQIKTVPDEKTGTTAFTLSADNLPEGAKIWFGVGSTDDMIEYDGGEVVLDATDIVYACIRGGAQSADGAMCHYLVIVPAKAQEPEKPTEPTDPSDPTDPTDPDDPNEPEQPGDRVSGRVKFELTDDGNGAVKVKISPEQTLTGEYEIWYTTNTGVTLPEGGTLYTGAFDMTESGLVMAVLVEKGKPAGQTCEVTVWVIPTPTAIDSVGADGAGNVRVDGDSIIAPEGSEVYDVTGRRVRPEGLRNGIYIVRTPDGNAVKVAIR